MRLSNLNKFIFLISIIFLCFSPLSSEEEEVDMWNKKNVEQDQQNITQNEISVNPNQNTKQQFFKLKKK